MIFPYICSELNYLGYKDFPLKSKVIFLTALKSIEMSLVSSMQTLGIDCASVTTKNIGEVLESQATVLFVGPETLKVPFLTKELLRYRSSFSLKVVDEVHLCKLFCLYISKIY